jgi:hypothetical protein
MRKAVIVVFTDTRRVKWEYEDNLGIKITDGMFKASEVIDGVRMYPYVDVDFGRYYIEI